MILGLWWAVYNILKVKSRLYILCTIREVHSILYTVRILHCELSNNILNHKIENSSLFTSQSVVGPNLNSHPAKGVAQIEHLKQAV